MAPIKEHLAKDGTKRFTAEIRLKGYPVQSATFKKKTDADKWIQDTESAIREGRHFKTTQAKKHTVSDMIERYLATANLNKVQQGHIGLHLKRWCEEIGYLTLADITANDIITVQEKLLTESVNGKPRSQSTVLKYVVSLNTVFNIAISNWGWIKESPMNGVKKLTPSRGRIRYLSDDERDRLLSACKQSKNKMLYVCVVLAIATGMRQGELMGLRWCDIDLKNGVAILHETKNGEKRRVKIAKDALTLLVDYLGNVTPLNQDALLFPSKTKPQQPIELKKAWQTALKNAQIDNFHWHDLRYCTASYLAMNNTSLTAIAEILGHKTLSMVKRYAHLSDGYTANEVETMNHKIFGGMA